MRELIGVSVLIVGAGPVGLLMAAGLRHFGVDCMVVEKHASTLDFPKGRRVTTRTVEVFRQWGLEAAVSDVSLPQADSLFVFEGETLLGEDFQRRGMPVNEVNPSSPTGELICSQELLEPVLRKWDQDDGADVRFLTEVVGFAQDDDGVTAEIVTDGEPVSVLAQYLVAADGVRGRTREALGVGWSGPGALGHRVSILVEADIEMRMKNRQSAVYWLREPRPGSLFAAVDNKSRWLCVVPYDPDAEPSESFTEHRCVELVRGGLGDDRVELRYIGHRIWEPTALVADRYQVGRVFLAGDAAHVTTPVGGLGMNCGVADVHNLAWKLAGVLADWASPALLESYEPERRPHAFACAAASLGPAQPPNPVDGLVLGHIYESAVIIDDQSAAPSAGDPIGEYLPVGRPGHRAPHLWLDRGARPSTCSARNSSRSPIARANGDSIAQQVSRGPREFPSLSTSSTPLLGTTSMESSGMVSCSSARTDTSRGGASGHLRRHTNSVRRCELPPATALTTPTSIGRADQAPLAQ